MASFFLENDNTAVNVKSTVKYLDGFKPSTILEKQEGLCVNNPAVSGDTSHLFIYLFLYSVDNIALGRLVQRSCGAVKLLRRMEKGCSLISFTQARWRLQLGVPLMDHRGICCPGQLEKRMNGHL